jgi:hypothetical protein
MKRIQTPEDYKDYQADRLMFDVMQQRAKMAITHSNAKLVNQIGAESMTNRPNFKAPEVSGFTTHPMADCPHCAFEGKVIHLTGSKGESSYCQECESHFLQYVPIKK